MYKTIEDIERVISLGKKQEVLDTFISSYLQGVELDAWTDLMKVEHEGLYPKQLPNPEYTVPVAAQIVNPLYVVDGVESYWIANPAYVEPVAEFIDNPDYIELDVWMAETHEVEVGTKDVLAEDGITVTGLEPVFATEVIRVFVEVPVDVEAWKATNPVYAKRLKSIKEDALNTLTVTTTAGNVFDADGKALINMLSALTASSTLGLTETYWRLADNSTALVSVDELKEAQALAIQAVGNVVLN